MFTTKKKETPMKEIKKSTNENVCNKCKFFEQRTHFCRLNTPTPVVFLQVEKDHNDNQIFVNKAGSKYPVIGMPEMDFCSKFEENIIVD